MLVEKWKYLILFHLERRIIGSLLLVDDLHDLWLDILPSQQLFVKGPQVKN
jgi:hypothetical protein